MAIRVAILTVSDTASANPNADLSGPAIQDIIAARNGFEVSARYCRIVPDDEKVITNVVREWCASGEVDWVITTGGTGFGVRDVTPEAISPLIQRNAPGLVHLMLSTSLKHTPLAALSRQVAGTIQSTLVTTLPGSVKAVKENLGALFLGGVVDHALELIKGDSGQRVHAKLAAGQSVADAKQNERKHDHHHHHHDGDHHAPKSRSQAALSHDPAAPVTARFRKSPFAQISLEDALSKVRENIKSLQVVTLPANHKIGGHVLAEDVYAPRNVPFTSTTSVDGYAIRSTDPPGMYKVLTSQSHRISEPLPAGSIYRINTGGPLPAGADTVIMVEDTELVSVSRESDGVEEEKEVKTLVQVPTGENVRKPGSDVREGELVMKVGERITRGGGEIGTLAFVGRKQVNVYKKPVVAILSTGNELVDLQYDPYGMKGSVNDGWGGIFDTNRPSLQAVLESMGYEVMDLGIVHDDISTHLTAIRSGLREADLLLTTGGTSMGPTDLLKPIIERYLDGVIHFGRVSVKPGKPTTFASVPVDVGEDGKTTKIWKPVFALPGNPASALVTFYVFVLPALRRMGGWEESVCELPKVIVQIQNSMPLDPRTEFHRVVIKSASISSSDFKKGGERVLKAYSTGGQRSSRVASLAKANGLVVLPPLRSAGDGETAMKTSLEVGEFVEAALIGDIEME